MKFPAVWIVAALATGIELAMQWPGSLTIWAAATGATVLAASVLLLLRRSYPALILILAAWLALGGVAVGVERASVPANHVSRLITAGRIDLSEPLRWRGQLREDPQTLPWGTRYEVALDEVEAGNQTLSVTGGLRANLYGDKQRARRAGSDFEAGDRVELLMRAGAPRNFMDPGAFDTRAYLATQGVDLVGSLRSVELIRLITRPQATIAQRLARARGDLLGRLNELFSGNPDRAAVLRAMLLGDRSFVDSSTVTAFQKTSAYHILVVAGLHVGAIVVFFFWICRRLRLSRGATTLVTWRPLRLMSASCRTDLRFYGRH